MHEEGKQLGRGTQIRRYVRAIRVGGRGKEEKDKEVRQTTTATTRKSRVRAILYITVSEAKQEANANKGERRQSTR